MRGTKARKATKTRKKDQCAFAAGAYRVLLVRFPARHE
jgi:hypothetical protein